MCCARRDSAETCGIRARAVRDGNVGTLCVAEALERSPGPGYRGAGGTFADDHRFPPSTSLLIDWAEIWIKVAGTRGTSAR